MAESSGSKSSCAAAAAPLSGRMPNPKNAHKNALAAAAVGGRDDISNLPDDVLQHILSFLPAQDAVRTCVLAKRWRHLWKSTTVLRFLCGGEMEPESMKEIQDFVDQLLRLRLSGGTPLDMCEFHLGKTDDNDMSRIDIWIRIALQCKVRVLQLNCTCTDHPIFISQYLKKLMLGELDDIVPVPGRLLDLSCCPNLEDLEIVDCYLGGALLISSQSLKRLTMEYCFFDYDDRRMPICARNLVSLRLQVCSGRIPLLQRMPSLLTASVINQSYDDYDIAESDSADYGNQSIFLHGLSEVRNLSLISFDDLMFVFRRDLKFCSSFNNLKSLLLNEYWCEPADFSALACLLKLCPVLEKLTLQLYSKGPKYKVEIKLNCNPLDLSAEISRHLKIVEVKCQVYDEEINNVLTFLTKQIFKMGHGSA